MPLKFIRDFILYFMINAGLSLLYLTPNLQKVYISYSNDNQGPAYSINDVNDKEVHDHASEIRYD